MKDELLEIIECIEDEEILRILLIYIRTLLRL